MSPFCKIASGPPCAASGQRWPIMMPWLAPEKRPSVTSATLSPSPRPTSAPPGDSISGQPGAPLGPSYLPPRAQVTRRLCAGRSQLGAGAGGASTPDHEDMALLHLAALDRRVRLTLVVVRDHLPCV